MPFTPFHLGPGLLIGLIFFKYIDFPTFLIASVIIDLEPFLVLFLGLNYPLHGFFHSFVGGTIVAVLLAFFMSRFNKKISNIISFFKLRQNSSFKNILLASLFGIYFHIILDSPLYKDIKPFYPLDLNPFYSMLISFEIYTFCTLSFFAGLVLCVYKLFRGRKNNL